MVIRGVATKIQVENGGGANLPSVKNHWVTGLSYINNELEINIWYVEGIQVENGGRANPPRGKNYWVIGLSHRNNKLKINIYYVEGNHNIF